MMREFESSLEEQITTSIRRTDLKPESLHELYPQLNAREYWFLPDRVNVVINDLPMRIPEGSSNSDYLENFFSQLANTMNKDLVVINGSDLTDCLIESLERQESWLKKNSVAALFPGGGAKVVKKFLQEKAQGILESFDGLFSFEARKVFSPEGRYERVEVKLPDELISRLNEFGGILVVDDVILTGETLRAVGDEIYTVTRTRLPLISIAWLCCDPRRRPKDFRECVQSSPKGYKECVPSSVGGYLWIEAVVVYSGVGTRGIVPVNSLSTWVRGDEKARLVLDGYQRKYVIDQKRFLSLIEELRQQLKNFQRDFFYL